MAGLAHSTEIPENAGSLIAELKLGRPDRGGLHVMGRGSAPRYAAESVGCWPDQN